MYLEKFIVYLTKEKQMSKNSIDAYRRDVAEYIEFCNGRGIFDVANTTNTEVVAYLFMLKNGEKSAATINRKLASIRAFYNYLSELKVVNENPTLGIKSPKVERKEIEFLTIEEIDKLLSLPEKNLKGYRDKAILEILYATGIRVNELISANLEDVNLRIGFFTCPGDSGKARIVPLGRPARKAVETYLEDARDMFVKNDRDEKALFVNYCGQRMTRQGLWKILKTYGKKAGFEQKITPHILRNSFAVHMAQNGADLKSLQELLGHEDISATQIYLSVTKNRIKDVYDKTHPRA
ncbi:MAG: site-specific tyrosine recombinase [Anaerovoracaceae bacterium]